MNVILADSIDGGVLMILFLFGGLVASVLALFALVPAWRGDRSSTFILAGPALVGGFVMTLYFAHGYFTDGLHDPDYTPGDFIWPWVILAGPALATSLLAVSVLCIKRARVKR